MLQEVQSAEAAEVPRWSELPAELLLEILKWLPTGLQLRTLVLVCKSWRAAVRAQHSLYLSPIYAAHVYSPRYGCGVGAAAHRAPLDKLIRSRASWLKALSVAESDAVKPKTTAASIATALQLSRLDLTYTEVHDADVQLIISACNKLEVLRLGRCEHLTDASVAALKQASLLQELSLSHTMHITGAAIASVFGGPASASLHLPNIKVLELAGISTLTDRQLAGIAKGLQLLEVLDVAGCSQVADESCHSIASTTSSRLRVANLSHTSVTDHGLAAVSSGCPMLQELLLVHCPSVKAPPPPLAGSTSSIRGTGNDERGSGSRSDAGGGGGGGGATTTATAAVAAGVVPGLKVLNISQVSGISAAGVKQLAQDHPSLVSISLCGGLGLGAVRRRGPEISAAAVLALWESCTALKTVDLSWCAQLEEGWFSQLSLASVKVRLTSLDISVTNITNTGLEHLTLTCPGLKTLKLADCPNISDTGLQYVGSNCRQLEALDVSECANVTDVGLDQVAVGCTSLRSLDASDCEQLTDAGVAVVLKHCKQLGELKVAETDVTDAILELAAGEGAPLLTSLDVHQCDSLTASGVLKFISQSGLRVLNIYYCRKLPVSVRDELVGKYPSLVVLHQGSMG